MDHGHAAGRVFAVPELLAQIINELAQTYPTQKDDSYITSLTEISPLALVSRSWVRPVQDEVWRSAKSTALRKVHPARRQNFANKIRRLHVLDCNDATGLDLGLPSLALAFPVLAEVIIGNPVLKFVRCYKADDLSELLWIVLSPKVRSVSLVWPGSYPVEAVLEVFRRQCPLVSSLRLWVYGAEGTELLQGLIKVLPHLENLDVVLPPPPLSRHGTCGVRDTHLFYWLSEVSSLRSLRFWLWMNPRSLPGDFQIPETLGSGTSTLLPRLRSFAGWAITCSQIQSLCAAMPFLAHLTLHVGFTLKRRAPELNPFSQLTSLHGLKSLHIYGSPFYRLSKEELSALTSFPQLVSLRIGHPRHYKYPERRDANGPNFKSLVEAYELTDDVFLQICRAMPLLEEMKLWLDHKLTSNGLVILGRQCRKLKTLLLPGEFHLLRLIDTATAEDTPLFPALRILSTEPLPLARSSTIMSSKSSFHSLEAKASSIMQHTPRLARVETAWRPENDITRLWPQREKENEVNLLELQRRKEERRFFQFSRPGGWGLVERIGPVRAINPREI